MSPSWVASGGAFSAAVVPVAVLVLFLAVVGFVWWSHRRRLQRKREWAASVGWVLVGTDRTLPGRWSERPFGVGRRRRVTELVVGTFEGRPAMSFAYRYTTGAGRNQRTLTFHVVAMALPAYLPTLELTPDNALQRFTSRFGAQDIQFESKAFNDAWRIVARDERFAHSVLHPRLMERLLQPDATGMSWRFEGTDVLCWAPGAPRYDLIGPRLRVMSDVVAGVPRFVWLDHGYDPGN